MYVKSRGRDTNIILDLKVCKGMTSVVTVGCQRELGPPE